MDLLQKVTIGIAVYGALVSSIVAGWSITKDLRDKPRLIPKYSTGFTKIHGWIDPIFSIDIVNPTKHRVVVNAVEIHFKKGKYIFAEAKDGLPKEILSNDSHTVLRQISEIKKLIETNGEPLKIIVRDTTGKSYRGSVQNMVKNVEVLYESTNEQ